MSERAPSNRPGRLRRHVRRANVDAHIRKTRVREIVAHAEAVFGVPLRAITGRQRLAPYDLARAAVCLVAFEQGWSGPAIGRVLAGRSHATVFSSIATAERLADFELPRHDPAFAARLLDLQDRARAPGRELVVVN